MTIFKSIPNDKHEILVKIVAGVFYIYINETFYCSCETWQECRKEIGEWLYENVK